MRAFAHPPALQRLDSYLQVEKTKQGDWELGDKQLEKRDIYMFENGDVYLGEWNPEYEMADGYGVKVSHKTGAIYQGYFEFGEMYGWGFFISG